MKLQYKGLVAVFALLGVVGCDFDTPEPYPQTPPPTPVAPGSTAPHLNPQHGFAAAGQTNFVPGDGTAPSGNGTGPTQPGTKIDPACAALPAGDACTECLKGDCCSVLLKCTKDKACSCLLKCVTTQPDNLVGCGIASGCGIPDMSFLSELTTCSKGCVDAKICKLPAGLPGGAGQSGIPGLPGGLGGLLGGAGSKAG